MKQFKSVLIPALAAGFIALSLSSCSTPQKVAYFQDLDENSITTTAKAAPITVEPGDKLSIIVHSKDPSLAALFNLPVISVRNTGLTNFNGSNSVRNYSDQDGMSYYTVSPDGNIDFPVLGQLHVAGMNRQELIGFIKGELMGRSLIKDPTITVEFVNTGINIFGEVRTPGRYDINRDNITVLEAIALAGDLGIQGRRENVRVIRQQADGTMKTYIIDLTSAEKTLQSPAYYLKQNDIIYVEPNNMMKRSTTVNGNAALQASFWISVAGLLASVATLIFK